MTTELLSVGIDIGKDTLHIVGFNDDGNYAFRKKDQAFVPRGNV